MKLAILGTGHIGGNLGKLLARAGHQVVFGSRDPASADISGDNIKVMTHHDAIASAEVVIEALPHAQSIALDAGALAGKVLITASNHYPDRDGEVDTDPSESEALAARLPESRVVKAFNMLYYKELEDRLNGAGTPGATYLVAGDDIEARQIAMTLAKDAGFDAVDAGALANGTRFQTDAEFYAKTMTKRDVMAECAE